MRISYNLAHWLCLIGGIALILTGFTVKTMLSGSSNLAHSNSGQTQSRPQYELLTQRALLILMGIGVVIYSLTRLVY